MAVDLLVAGGAADDDNEHGGARESCREIDGGAEDEGRPRTATRAMTVTGERGVISDSAISPAGSLPHSDEEDAPTD